MSDSNLLMLTLPEYDPTHQGLIDAFNDLPALHQTIVCLLAVINEAVARTYVVAGLKKMTAGDPAAPEFTVGGLASVFDALVEARLLLQDGIYFMCCQPLREPLCRTMVDDDCFDRIAAAAHAALAAKGEYRRGRYISYGDLVREMRIGLYRGDTDRVRTLVEYFNEHFYERYGTPHPYITLFGESLDSRWMLAKLPLRLNSDIARILLAHQEFRDSVFKELLALATTCLTTEPQQGDPDAILIFLAEELILRGRIDEVRRIAAIAQGMTFRLIEGCLAFLGADTAAALVHFDDALAQLKKATRKRKLFFVNLCGIFYILALLTDGSEHRIREALTLAATGNQRGSGANRYHGAFPRLTVLAAALANTPQAVEAIAPLANLKNESNPLMALVTALVVYWLDKERLQRPKKYLKQFHANTAKTGYRWIAAENAVLLSRLSKKDATMADAAAAFFQRAGIRSIVARIQPETAWKRALNALVAIRNNTTAAGAGDQGVRLVWLLDYNERGETWDLSPREQKKTATGQWSKGRKIALKRLAHDPDAFDYLTPQDRAVCACIEEEHAYSWGGYREVGYDFNPRALKALAGHPLVFADDSRRVPLEILAGKPELIVEHRPGDKYRISLKHGVDVTNKVRIVRETPTRFKVIEANDDVIGIAKIIGKGLIVPAHGKTRLLEAVDSLSAIVNVHSQVADIGESAREIDAATTPCVHLRPFGSGLKIELMAQPFAGEGPCFSPGEGGATIVAGIAGRHLRTKRRLDEERERAAGVVAACRTLSGHGGSSDGPWEWLLHEPEDCLETLLELQALGDAVVLKWPEGETLQVRPAADTNRFHLRVRKQRDWFAVSGELKLDDGLVLSMEQLLSLMEQAQGRFLRLEDGPFLALTRSFRRRLEELAAYSQKTGNNRRFHPLAALTLDDWADQLGGFLSDSHWKAHLARFNDARAVTPEIPSTFKAELRDYQAAGFNWLFHLSCWGAGACLADDMGLGKTIQALAIIVARAAGGPTLVVAPTSVGMNWETEARRFAPTLNVVSLGNGNRQKIVAALAPFDLLLVTYGLLQQKQVAEMLAGVRFRTAVLDEAQAIKNVTTKRSRAAMNLQADFRLITTGTPIENHLGELWNLFRFINPGLLGTLKEFNTIFAVPIEKNRDQQARQRLKKLVRPFILRRTKSQVLDELPERTDILLQVDLTAEELALYEALRQQALEKLAVGEESSQNKHVRILAEIMKLRRACCNSRLVVPDVALPSAKLTVFGDIVADLLANGHKALVFSQFTDHLAIIRAYVEKEAIPYQYLDGGTPQKVRKERVEAFQAGRGDLFLISLKAGGLGLNLTAADYVIHMDPWWNPAVEDQASDRAHRIGQMRAVTVYRLVARHTIEEKIVALHRHKRDLADSLLDGTDMSGKMTADELLRLIKEK